MVEDAADRRALAVALLPCLAATDPALRDGIGYEALSTWMRAGALNADTLREAQQRPQDFAGLVVRVAGYSAFFVELSKEIQDDIIRRTAHQL